MHPVFRSLKCHFQGTAFINDSSQKNLISPGGLIDSITAPSIEHPQSLPEDFLAPTFRFNDSITDVELSDRGIMGERDGEDQFAMGMGRGEGKSMTAGGAG